MYLRGVRTAHRLCAVLCAVVLLLALAPAGWALVPRMDLPALVQQSKAVIVGTVTGKRSRWEENGGMIYTYVTVRVEQVVAGAVGRPVITIKCPGGTVGDITCEVSDVPSFSVGERAILFLRDEFFSVVGWRQGKKPIRNGRVVGERMSETGYLGLIRSLARRGRPRVRTRQAAGPLLVEPASRRALRGPRVGLRQAPGVLGIRPLAPDTLMTDDFEGAWPGVWSFGGSPRWGRDDYNPHGGTYSVWCAKDGAGLDPEFDNYALNMEAWMVCGPFDLSTSTSASLDFYLWLRSESGWDYFYCMASHDGGYFEGWGASGDSGGWISEQLDLSDWLGDDSVWIAFIFQSDHIVTFKGAFVDDVSIVAETGGPVINSITPDEESAGTDTEVTIDGQDFGASQGTSEVEFYYRSSQPNKVANIVSWSDTQIVCTVPMAASSGPVTVVTPEGTSNGYPFTVTFGYLGRRWPDPPVPSYEINENTGDCTDEGAAIQAAAGEWNTWTSGTDFGFSYVGATNRQAPIYDSHNVLRWNNGIGGSIATCWTWYSGSTIVECDVEFEDNFDWATDPATPGGSYDVHTIALHEMGHWLSLADLYGGPDSAKVMYGYGSTGQQTRETVAEDRLGLYWIYSEPTIASLSSFSAALVGRTGTLIEFDWLDLREVVGFELCRRGRAAPLFEKLQTLWSVPGRQHYRILDPGGGPGTMYQVRSIYPDGRRQRHGDIVARPSS